MRNISVLCTLFCTLAVSAQNWSLLNSKESYNYTVNGDTLNSIIYTVETDSLDVAGGDSVFYMNRRIRPCHKCSSYNTYVLGPVFDLFGTKVIQKTDTFLFVHNDTNVIIPTANINDTWVFNASKNQIARVDTIYSSVVLGEEDSLKVISVAGVDTAEVIISKNHGILSFFEPGEELYIYDMDRYLIFKPGNFDINRLKLIGLSFNKKGIYPPEFSMYYSHLSAGDFVVYSYKDLTDWEGMGYYEKRVVTGITHEDDSIIFDYRTYKKVFSCDYLCYYDIIVGDGVFQSNLTESISNSLNNYLSVSTGELVRFYSEKVYSISIPFMEYFWHDGLLLSVSNRINNGKFEKVFSLYEYYYEIYRMGEGLVTANHMSTTRYHFDLIGYNINGTSSGVITSLDDREWNSLDQPNTYFRIYTDNKSKTLKINAFSGDIFPDNLKFQVSDLSGRIMYSEKLVLYETVMDISHFSPGIYILTITGNNVSESHKFSVEF